jgi:aspartyl-tRNA(Asn)/glutamyl-tRNA(Gln) amidotransferase subunit A
MMEEVVGRFRERGASIVDVALPAGFAEVLKCHRAVMAVESAWFHGERLRRHPDDYAPKIRSLIEEGLACPGPEYARCKEHQKELARDMLACFEAEARVDAILAPATTGPPPDAATTGDPAFNSPWSYTGLPVVSLPAAWDPAGLPLAVQLAGPPWSEAELLAAAAWCEQALAFEWRDAAALIGRP